MTLDAPDAADARVGQRLAHDALLCNDAAAAQPGARLERLAQHVPGILYEFELTAERTARLPYLSDRGRVLLGLDPEHSAVDARRLLERIDVADRAALTAGLVASARTLAEWRCEFRIDTASQGLRWMRASASPSRHAGGVTRWHGYVQDVTELRELERTHQDQAAAEAARRAQSEFLSRMSHELRTPLNAVLGFSQLLEIDRADRLSDGQRRRVRLIREAGEQLLQMIGDLLDLTRIESGRMQLQPGMVPLRELADEALQMVRAQAHAAQVNLQLQAPAQDLAVHADRSRLRQVLANLLLAAIKCQRAGGSVQLRMARMTRLASGDDPRTVSIVVHACDVDLPAAERAHPLEAFDPASHTASAPGLLEGTAFGLSATRALVTLMGARLQLGSRVDGGTGFELTLPAA